MEWITRLKNSEAELKELVDRLAQAQGPTPCAQVERAYLLRSLAAKLLEMQNSRVAWGEPLPQIRALPDVDDPTFSYERERSLDALREIAGQIEKTKNLAFGFLAEGVKYKLTLIADGTHDRELAISYSVVDKSSSVDVKFLRRGGFAATVTRLP